MAGLRVFISSTCYDFSLLRSQLRGFVNSMGYEPIMSDYEDVLYDPREHTHTSCINEVGTCDIVVLIIGGRFGGKATAEALGNVDFDKLKKEGSKVETIIEEENLSITQLEVLKAIESGIPVYTFIDEKVWNDHNLYEKNKTKDIIDQIVFPFEKGQDIEEILRKQWSGYFQRLLSDQRFIRGERKRVDILSEQFEELKMAILSSIDNVDQRQVARGIIKYRRLFDFLFALKPLQEGYLRTTTDSWDQLMQKAEIKEVIDVREYKDEYSMRRGIRMYLVCNNHAFYEFRIPKDVFDSFPNEWFDFIQLSEKTKEIIMETLQEMGRGMMVRYVNEDFEAVMERRQKEQMRPVITNREILEAY